MPSKNRNASNKMNYLVHFDNLRTGWLFPQCRQNAQAFWKDIYPYQYAGTSKRGIYTSWNGTNEFSR